jgi:protein gp37
MADHSPIEWTEATWNPIAGCSLVSPGCTNCYAMRRVAPRLAMNPATPHYAGTVQNSKAGPVWTGRIGIASDAVLLKPLRWKRPRMIFVNSTSDLFHPGVPDAVIDRIFAVMALCPQHTFQVLTKRPERMREYFAAVSKHPIPRLSDDIAAHMGEMIGSQGMWANEASEQIADRMARALDPDTGGWPLPNVWLGTSVEDQQRADERIPHLLATPAALRFISAEPLLGPLEIGRHLHDSDCAGWVARGLCICSEPREVSLDWVIVGGESGPGARPMHPDWVRSLRDQCADAQVPFFFKQWGEWHPCEHGEGDESHVCRPMPGHAPFDSWKAPIFDPDREAGWNWRNIGKAAAGRLLDGAEHNGMPGGR